MTERFCEQEPIIEEDHLTRVLSEESVSQGCPLTRPIIAPELAVGLKDSFNDDPQQDTNSTNTIDTGI